jgi:hypothetical protein
MQRFAMTFDRGNNFTPAPQLVQQSLVPMAKRGGASLNAPMIDRVHRAKPGCSACGKKVM